MESAARPGFESESAMRPRRWMNSLWKTVEVVAIALVAVNAGCGPLSAPLSAPAAITSTPSPLLPSFNEPASAGSVTTVSPVASTPTLGEFELNLTPLPTATALPTLVLPTESRFAGTFEVWDGIPTYPADSQAGFDFRLRYDPGTWALTKDQYGSPALAHRTISGCTVTPVGGRGLPLNGTVEHDIRRVNGVSFQINTAFVNGIRQFVTYIGGDGVIYTGFMVAFSDHSDQCLADAEEVLGTLKAVSVNDATPIATP